MPDLALDTRLRGYDALSRTLGFIFYKVIVCPKTTNKKARPGINSGRAFDFLVCLQLGLRRLTGINYPKRIVKSPPSQLFWGWLGQLFSGLALYERTLTRDRFTHNQRVHFIGAFV